MRPHYTIAAKASPEPLSIDEMSAHVRIDSADDLEYLQALLEVAREFVDGATGRVSGLSTWDVVAPSWHALIHGDDEQVIIPGRNVYSIPIFRAPLVSVTSVKYYAPDDEALTTVSSSDYRVITGTQPGIVQFKAAPPAVEDRPDACQIRFVAGYGDPADIPPGHRHAVKMVLAHFYENRVPISMGGSMNQIPFTLQTLIDQQKIGGWIA